jgi:hypothetical protein
MVQRIDLNTFFIAAKLQDRRRVDLVSIHGRIGRAMKESVHRVILASRQRIEFMVVANRTTCRQTHPNFGHRCRSIDSISINPFFVDAATFAGRDIAAVETRSDQLLSSRLR